MTNKNPKISVIIPTRNSSQFLRECLSSVVKQSYKNFEIIIVDNQSKDKTVEIAREYTHNIYDISDLQKFEGKFSATYQRNYGVTKSKGEIVYYVDADMQLQPDVLKECAETIENGATASIIPEDSFGSTYWAKCKQLERRCYWGDSSIEAPRCLLKSVWEELGGLDENVAGGGDDWDLHEKLKEGKYSVGRINAMVMHNEGALTLTKLIKKRFLYGKDTMMYVKKRSATATKQYFPIRMGFIKNWKLFLQDPIIGFGTIFMRLVEYFSGACGIIYSLIKK